MTFVIPDFHPSPTGFFSHGGGHHATHHHSHHRHEESAFAGTHNYRNHTESSIRYLEQRSCLDCFMKNLMYNMKSNMKNNMKSNIKNDTKSDEYVAFVKAVTECKKDAICVQRAIKNAIKPEDLKTVASKCGDVCKEEKHPRQIKYNKQYGGSLPGFTSNIGSLVAGAMSQAIGAFI